MEKQFRVAYVGVVAGDPDATGYEERCDRVGIVRFSAPAETILDIVKNTEPSGSKLDCSKLQIKLEQQLLSFSFGGRTMDVFSMNEFSDASKDIEIFIISSSSDSHFFIRYSLITFAREASLSTKSCPVILQFPSMPFDFTNTYAASVIDVEDILSCIGIKGNDKQVSTGGRFKRKQKGGYRQKIIVIGHETYGGVEADVGISQLQSVLFQTELTENIIKPVKETMSAGKSFLNIGRSFGGWITNLFSSN